MPVFTQFEIPGDTPVDDVVVTAKEVAGPLIDPLPDVRGGSAYKTRLGLVAVEEAVRSSWKERDDERRIPFLGRRRRR